MLTGSLGSQGYVSRHLTAAALRELYRREAYVGRSVTRHLRSCGECKELAALTLADVALSIPRVGGGLTNVTHIRVLAEARRRSDPRVFAIVGDYEGMGKTSVALLVASVLSRYAAGARVLCVDLDPNGDLTRLLIGGRRETPTSRDVLVEDAVSLTSAIIESTALEGVSLVPSSPELTGIDRVLLQKRDWETLLRRKSLQVDAEYDHVVIDCASGRGTLAMNALVAADLPLSPAFDQSHLRPRHLRALASFIQGARAKNPHLLPALLIGTNVRPGSRRGHGAISLLPGLVSLRSALRAAPRQSEERAISLLPGVVSLRSALSEPPTEENNWTGRLYDRVSGRKLSDDDFATELLGIASGQLGSPPA